MPHGKSRQAKVERLFPKAVDLPVRREYPVSRMVHNRRYTVDDTPRGVTRGCGGRESRLPLDALGFAQPRIHVEVERSQIVRSYWEDTVNGRAPSEPAIETPRNLGRIQRRSLSEEVLLAIERGIMSGQLKPGDRLVEAELAEELGVSRAPVREALIQLQQQGLVVTRLGRGAEISRWSPRDVEELYDLRSLLESHAAYLGASQMTDPEVVTLGEIVAGIRRAAEAADGQAMSDLDMEFHSRLSATCRQSRLLRVLQSTQSQTRVFMTMLKAYRLYPDMLAVARSHEALMEIIRTRDPEAVAAAVRQHVVNAGKRLYDRLREEEEQQAPREDTRLLQ